jgi:uncharacterized protein (UPF0276 family)
MTAGFHQRLPPQDRWGVGLGLRPTHYQTVLTDRPAAPWFEVITENYMGPRGGSGGRPLEILEKIRRDTPVVLHGVSLNLGSTDPLDRDYLRRLKTLARRLDVPWVSDHLCWTGAAGQNLHDLLPLPYTKEALAHVVNRLRQVQDFLERPLLIENVSSYITYRHSTMTEWEFLSRVAEQADAGILFDVNNIYVSARNHGFDPEAYIAGIPADRVREIHLAGYSDEGDLLVDTHDHPVWDPVWDLYEKALRRLGPVPTLIEWDADIPPFQTLWAEAQKAEEVRRRVLAVNA